MSNGYHYETLRTLGSIGSGGADISEVLQAVSQMSTGVYGALDR